MTDNTYKIAAPSLRIRMTGIAIAVFTTLATAYVVGASEQAQLQDAAAQFEAQQNASFCTELGIDASTKSYTGCLEGMNKLRRKHEEWVRSAIVGIL